MPPNATKKIKKLKPDLIIPESMGPRVVPGAAEFVSQATKDSGIIRL